MSGLHGLQSQVLVEDIMAHLAELIGAEAAEDDTLAKYIVAILPSSTRSHVEDEMRELLDDIGVQLVTWVYDQLEAHPEKYLAADEEKGEAVEGDAGAQEQLEELPGEEQHVDVAHEAEEPVVVEEIAGGSEAAPVHRADVAGIEEGGPELTPRPQDEGTGKAQLEPRRKEKEPIVFEKGPAPSSAAAPSAVPVPAPAPTKAPVRQLAPTGSGRLASKVVVQPAAAPSGGVEAPPRKRRATQSEERPAVRARAGRAGRPGGLLMGAGIARIFAQANNEAVNSAQAALKRANQGAKLKLTELLAKRAKEAAAVAAKPKQLAPTDARLELERKRSAAASSLAAVGAAASTSTAKAKTAESHGAIRSAAAGDTGSRQRPGAEAAAVSASGRSVPAADGPNVQLGKVPITARLGIRSAVVAALPAVAPSPPAKPTSVPAAASSKAAPGLSSKAARAQHAQAQTRAVPAKPPGSVFDRLGVARPPAAAAPASTPALQANGSRPANAGKQASTSQQEASNERRAPVRTKRSAAALEGEARAGRPGPEPVPPSPRTHVSVFDRLHGAGPPPAHLKAAPSAQQAAPGAQQQIVHSSLGKGPSARGAAATEAGASAAAGAPPAKVRRTAAVGSPGRSRADAPAGVRATKGELNAAVTDGVAVAKTTPTQHKASAVLVSRRGKAQASATAPMEGTEAGHARAVSQQLQQPQQPSSSARSEPGKARSLKAAGIGSNVAAPQASAVVVAAPAVSGSQQVPVTRPGSKPSAVNGKGRKPSAAEAAEKAALQAKLKVVQAQLSIMRSAGSGALASHSAPTPAQPHLDPCAVRVRNVHPKVTHKVLEAHFQSCGPLKRTMLLESHGQRTGEALIEFESEEAATRALALNGSLLLNQKVQVLERLRSAPAAQRTPSLALPTGPALALVHKSRTWRRDGTSTGAGKEATADTFDIRLE